MAEEISGVLCFNKPQGISSHDAVNIIRRLYGTKKVGHAGTLDPLAEGVLVMMLGRAVKAAEYLSSGSKKYIAGMKLGVISDTEDISGRLIRVNVGIPGPAEVVRAARGFKGEIMQTPPMYSAIKVNGSKLVNLARRGIEVEREARKVRIDSLNVECVDEESGDYELAVSCSKGTYIRTLCSDIGKTLGCGAVMSSLLRVGCCGFGLSDSHTLGEIEQADREKRLSFLLPTETLFKDLRKLQLPDFFSHLAHSGCEIYLKKLGLDAEPETFFSLYDKDGFFAVGKAEHYADGIAVKPLKLFRL